MFKRIHKVSEDSRLGVQGRLWGSSTYLQVQDLTLPSCGLMRKAVGRGTGFAQEKWAAVVEEPLAFMETQFQHMNQVCSLL